MDYCLDFTEVFQALDLIKIIEQYQGKETAQRLFPIHADEPIYETYLTALDSMEGLVKSAYNDDDNISLYRFERKEMTEYFHLAHKYGDILNLPKDSNPYIQAVYGHLADTIFSIPSYCYGARLYDSKTRRARLYFLHDCDYWMPIDTIRELYAFFDFFLERLPALTKAVKKSRKSARRKAA
jgi:hypothetical protein